ERGLFRIESGQSLALEAQLFNGISMEYGGQPSENVGQSSPAQNTQFAPPSSQSTALFAKYTVKLSDNQTAPDGAGKEPNILRFDQLTLGEISKLTTTAKTDKERRQAVVELHKRFAFPFACLTLTAITFILAIQGRRFSTRPRTVMAILFLAMGFYLLLVLG